MSKKNLLFNDIAISKLVHGGQGMGVLPPGKKCFVWGVLPGEIVNIKVTKNKKDWAEAIVTDVIRPSKYRIAPQEPEAYLSTSPWQIMDYSYENIQKQEILAETYGREGIDVDWQEFYQPKESYGYRNKMEYNFWYDNDTGEVSLALHRRGSHLKIALEGSALATDAINITGKQLIKYINDNEIEARPLKSVILRSDKTGRVGISLFVNDKEVALKFSKFHIQNSISEILYSNPKSPASVATEVIKPAEDLLTDNLLGKDFKYSTRSFFQANVPVYEQVLQIIASELNSSDTKSVLDMYSGVGSIGLSVINNNQKLTMVETEETSTIQAKANINGRPNCKVVTTTAESALDYIADQDVVILDPPRAGLHKKVTEKLIIEKPQKIIYLSCNPATQARDVKSLIGEGYKVTYAQGFNFFPRTPHIESLIILNNIR